MLHSSQLVLVATTLVAVAAKQCCFQDGDIITLKSDVGLHLGRCNNCIQREAYVDSAFVHVDDPSNSPWAQWKVINTGNGKIALQADSGKYLGRCNNCVYWAAYPDEAFVHVSDWTTAPWAQWKCHEVGDGKIALEADTGKYLARCNNCVSGAYPNTGMVHAKSSDDSWARWRVAQNGKFIDDRCSTPTSKPNPTTSAPPPTTAPAPTTNVPAPVPTTTTSSPATTAPVPATTAPPSPTTTPAPVTTTPAPISTAPPSPTTAPAPVTTAPPPTTPAPATTAPAPAMTAPAPVTTAPPSPTTAPAPVTSAPPPATTAPAPVTTAPAPAPTTAAPVPTTSPGTCNSPRVRKAWSALSDTEKTTYKNAIAAAMDSGMFERFLSMHREQMGNIQAHNTCVFIYWHRQFLVGFENMLRSLDPSYACVTIPYFDYVNDNTKYMSGSCSTINTCSSIVNELGSASSGQKKSVTINGYAFSSRCDNVFPLNHFNQNEKGASGTPYNCVPRGKYTSSYFPSAVGFTGIKEAIIGDNDVSTVNSAIEDNPHNYMHDTLGGAMANTFVSPADPIFYSHHSMIDALNAIYYKCRVAPQGFTDAQKQTNVLSFEGCSVNGSPITATTSIKMRAIINGNVVDVRSEPSTKSYFDGVPDQYYKLTDNTNLEANSYSYEFSGLLADLFTNCGASGLTTSGNLRSLSRVATSATNSYGQLQNYVTPEAGKHVKVYKKWRAAITKQAKKQGWTAEKTEAEIYKIVVAYYHYCLPGGIKDLSDEFKAMWHVTDTPKQIKVLKALLDNSDPIQLPGYEDINYAHFNCAGKAPAY